MTFLKASRLNTLRLGVFLLLNTIGFSLFAQKGSSNLILFGRSTYPGDDSTYEMIRHSGFNTLMLSSFYIKSNGDVLSGDDAHHPVIHNGKYVGSNAWLRHIQSLRKSGSTVNRIEILLEGRWYGQPPNTYDFIRDWIDGGKADAGVIPGIEKGSTLYTIVRLLKQTVGADAICIDDESVYDSTSIVRLGQMCHGLGMKMSLCPFAKIPFWKYIIDNSRADVVDAVYLQCYDGGTHNTPGPWAAGLNSSIPVYPIFLCRGAFDTCGTNHNSKTPDEIAADMASYKKAYSGLKGAGIWQIADIKNFIRLRCAVTDPSSGTATTVPEFLEQLKNALQQGL